MRALLLTLVASLIGVAAWGCREPAPPPPPPIDPRVDVFATADVNAPAGSPPFGGSDPQADALLDDQARFALALTGHRRKEYTGDLNDVRSRGVLRVLTRNNSTSYFLYKGVEAGFDYEIARWLAKELGVRLEMVVAPTRRELVPWLLDGKGDIILAGLSTEAARSDRVRFSRPYLETPWVVVVRKPRRGRPLQIDKVEDLAGVPLLVRPSSGAMPRVRALGIGGLVIKGALESLESEELLDAVGDKSVAAAVVEERIAKVELLHRSDLQVAFTLPGGDDVAGIAVRKEDEALWAFVDDFVSRHRKGTDWNVTFMKYHSSKERTAAVRDDALRADKEGRVSPWDDVFVQAGAEHDVDWRLLAAQAYQESRFDAEARSPMGAVGVMQLLPSTAKELGCDRPDEPRPAIRAAARYLSKLMQRFDADAEGPHVELKDRVRFALAAYNAGPAHLDDARLLAKAQGLDANRWFGHVEKAMLLLSKPKHYQTAAHGFARGDETVRYVSEIQTRYDAYVGLALKTADRRR